MNQILYSGKVKKKPIALFISIVVVLLLIVLFVCFGFGLMNLSNNKILKGVVVANVDVSEMTKEEAIEVINKAYAESTSRNIALNYEGGTINITTEDIDFGYTDANLLVDEAYKYGREGNILKDNFTVLKSHMSKEKRIETAETIDKEKLKDVVNEMISGDVFSRDDFYEVSGDKLLITKGTEGRKIDFDTLHTRILDALKSREMNVEIPVIVSKPTSLDIDLVYDKVRRSPKNATYVSIPKFEIIKEENGLDFDADLAKEKYLTLAAGETAEIELIIVEPEKKVADLGDILFKNLIATFTSTYDQSNTNRVTNLKVASDRCNNTILYPGDEFSYNKALGHRTTANGYKMGASYAGGRVVQTVGGGICQVSSTLYNAVLRADLTITDRTAHGMYVEYVPQSTDATVVDNAIDFKFRNDREYPVKLVTTCENGVVTASVYGFKDEDEPTIDIETKILKTVPYETVRQNDSSMKKGTTKVVQDPVNGYVYESYKVYYKDGKEISRKLITKDSYTPTNEIIKVGTKVEVVTPPPVVEEVKPPVAPEIVNPLLPPGWDSPESGY